MFWAYVAVSLLAVIVAASELVSRYRDDPVQATTSRSGVIYILINVGVSIGVFYLIRNVLELRDPPAAGKEFQRLVWDVFLAGASAMVILRTSLMTIHVNGKDVQIGLAAVIDVFRSAVDRDVDRLRAGPRTTDVSEIMKQISFVRARGTLTSVALSAMQNVNAEERAQIEQRVAALANQSDRSDASKAQELGLILAGIVGFKNLRTMVNNNRDSISTALTRTAVVDKAVEKLDTDVILKELPVICLLLSPQDPESQKSLEGQIQKLIEEPDKTEHTKSIGVALLLAHFVGEESFNSAVALLDKTPDSQKPTPQAKPESKK